MDNMSPISDASPVIEQRLEFEDVGHTGQILSQLNQLHKRGQFCDAKLIVGEHETGIHRAILASASRFFFDMFLKEEDEDQKNQTVFKLKEVSWETFSPLLTFIYTGRLSIPGDQVKAVYKVSQQLRITSATMACAQYLISCLTPDNCLGIRSFVADDTIREQINKYIADNIKEVTNSKKFYGLSRISLEIVGSDEDRISRTCNEELLPEVLLWLRNKMADHKNKLDWLVEDLIVLYLSTDNSLTDCIDVEDTSLNENELVQDYKNISRKKLSGQVKPKDPAAPETTNGLPNYRKFSINPELPIQEMEWSLVASYKTKDRTYMVIAMLNGNLVTISVHYRSAVSNSSGTDDLDSPVGNGYAKVFDRFNDLSPLASMSTNRCAFGLKTLQGKLFACGGYHRGECLKSTEVYDFKQNVWTLVDDMKFVRGRFCIGLHKDNVYACGGSGGNCDINTVECYNSEEGKWSVIAQAPHAKASPGVAVLQDKLYMIGGCIGQSTVASCEAFDLNTHTWSSVAPMHLSRYQVAVTVFRNRVYAIGGTNGWRCLNDVEVYDPNTKEWSVISPLNIARRGAGVEVYNGKIFIVGGNDGTSALNSTEFFDPDTHTWNVGPTLGTPRANCGVTLLDDKLFAVGGFSGKKFLNTMEYLDLENTEYWCSYNPSTIPEKESSKTDENSSGKASASSSTKAADSLNGQTDANCESVNINGTWNGSSSGDFDKQTVKCKEAQGKGQGSQKGIACNGDIIKPDIQEANGERNS